MYFLASSNPLTHFTVFFFFCLLLLNSSSFSKSGVFTSRLKNEIFWDTLGWSLSSLLLVLWFHPSTASFFIWQTLKQFHISDGIDEFWSHFWNCSHLRRNRPGTYPWVREGVNLVIFSLLNTICASLAFSERTSHRTFAHTRSSNPDHNK